MTPTLFRLEFSKDDLRNTPTPITAQTPGVRIDGAPPTEERREDSRASSRAPSPPTEIHPAINQPAFFRDRHLSL